MTKKSPKKAKRKAAKRRIAVWACVVLAIALLAGGAAALLDRIPVSAPADTLVTQDGGEMDGNLRVLLLSLESPRTLTITVSGNYAIDEAGIRFSRGSQFYVTASNNSLYLVCGGMSVNMGSEIVLTRHACEEGEENGLHILESRHGNFYNGDLHLTASGSSILPVLHIDIEEYLYGVVCNEMSDSWPIEALKAQAVAARTYAMQKKAERTSWDYDVVDTTQDQVFKGYMPATPNTVEAVNATRGIVGMYKGSLATCFYGASNGGQTVMPETVLGTTSDCGYLDVRDDPYDLENPNSVVKTIVFSADPAETDSRLSGLLLDGAQKALALSETDKAQLVSLDGIAMRKPIGAENSNMYSEMVFAFTLDVNGEEKQVKMAVSVYDTFKPLFPELKINSIDCEVYTLLPVYEEQKEDDPETEPKLLSCTVEARRFGHGVGMSQRGAQRMAGAHQMTCTDILSFYYPKMDIVRFDMTEKELTPLAAGDADALAVESVEAELPEPEEGEVLAEVVLTDSPKLNVREKPGTQNAIVSTLFNGQKVLMGKPENGWAHVRNAYIEGYCSTDYLKEVK